MKNSLIRLFGLLYRFITAAIIIATPLFFIPTKAFGPQFSYYVVVVIGTTLSLLSYVAFALLARVHAPLSRREFIFLSLFASTLLASSLFSRDVIGSFFGRDINFYSGASFLIFPAIIYLVRALPAAFSSRLRVILFFESIIGTAFFAVMAVVQTFVTKGTTPVLTTFTSPLSLALYVGIPAVLGAFLMTRKHFAKKHRLLFAIAALVGISLFGLLFLRGDVRPSITASLKIAGHVLTHDGPFGVGSGEFGRAWQLYKPSEVLSSPYFSYEFLQAFSLQSTLLSTIGIVGFLIFLALVLWVLLVASRAFLKEEDVKKRTESGGLFILLCYFAVLSFIVPFSYSLLVLWMILIGFSLSGRIESQGKTTRYTLGFLLFLLLVLSVHSTLLLCKTYSLTLFQKSSDIFTTGDVTHFDEGRVYLDKAISAYPMDGFYRTKAELILIDVKTLLSTPGIPDDALRKGYADKVAEARKVASLAVASGPDNYQNYVTLGRMDELLIPLLPDDGYAQAKAAYNKAIALYPNNIYLYTFLARLEVSKGNTNGAKDALKEALLRKADFTDALYLMSQIAASEKNNDESLLYALKAIQANPQDRNSYKQAGILLYQRKSYNDAFLALSQALRMDPTDGSVAYLLALTLRDAGEKTTARLVVDELLKQNPNNVDLVALRNSLEEVAAPATTTKKIPKAPTKGSRSTL